MSKLINLIPNSSFENFTYNNKANRPDTITIADWTISSENQICGKYSHTGGYSMSLKASGDVGGNSLISKIGTYDLSHKYYFRGYFKLTDTTTTSERITITVAKDIVSIIESVSKDVETRSDLNWTPISHYFDDGTNIIDNDSYLWLNQNTKNGDSRVLVDSLMLIDLTESFGDGYEPSQEWCDNNIPYFETDYDLDQIPKEIEFTCKDSFVYDERTKKYYTNTYSPKITFVVRNVDKHYNEDNTISLRNRIYFTSRASNSKQDVTNPTSTITINQTNSHIEFKDNDAYFTFTGFTFGRSRHHTIFTIYSDISGGYRVQDELTVYFIGNYDEFEYNLNYDLSYASTYLRKLKGTTNAYDDVPTNIDVFINGVKTSPVDILNQDDKLTVFEKDLYLSDGKNIIEVVATDICGNTKSVTSEIYIDCMTPIPEKEVLLENFIADDDNKVSLHLGNADLSYKTKNAGLNKDVNIDTSVASHYFTLEGENANLYRISKDNIPKIQSDIIKRPLAITFDYVEKIYDGNNEITPVVKKLELDNGYYLHDVHKEYNDFAGSGFVRGSSERRVTSETIFKAYDEISEEYVINKPNVDYSNFYINIDGVEGYSLLDASTGNAEILLHNKSLNKTFKSIELIRNDNTTVLRFNYVENTELKYKVANGVNIKYNYRIDNELNATTYKTSDKETVHLDFSKAYFKTKDVTDEVQTISYNDLEFAGKDGKNYQIANYSSTGKIVRREIYPHITCLDKVYDGSVIVPFEMSSKYYNGLENSISGDDVYLDNTYEGNHEDNLHRLTKYGSSILVYDNANVGTNKPVAINSLFLEGIDAKNYKIGNVTSNFSANILPRKVDVVINKIRLIRSNCTWQIDYTFLNDIKEDQLTINYNSNDVNDIKVYGGIDENGDSIHKNYNNLLDILLMYFKYNFNLDDERFVNSDSVTNVADTTANYWTNEARLAQPNTERIDIIAEYDDNQEGNVKLTLGTTPDGVQTSYFESSDKAYKLYNGCKVMVTNIKLDPTNPASKNYELKNSTCETTIEII